MLKTESPVSRLLVTLALIAVQVLFGVNYVISKVVVTSFAPLIWASVRAFIAGAFLLIVAVLLRRKAPSGRQFFIPLIAYALLGIIINQASFLVGLRHTTAINSAVLNTLIPVFTLLIVTLRKQEPLTRSRLLGFGFAFMGVLVLGRVETLSVSSETLLGDLLTVLNCFSYALFLSYAREFLRRHDRVWTTAWLFVYGCAGLSLIAIPDYATFHMPVLTPYLLGCMAFAVVGGTILTYFLNLWALARVTSSSVALFIYLQPIVAAGVAWAWLGQVPKTRTVLSCLLIFISLLFALVPKRLQQATAS